MRSLLASLRTLILPFGQIGGPRIVLDGTTGTIEIYDVNNDLVAVLGDLPGVANFSGFQVNEAGNPLGASVVLTADPDPKVWFYTGDTDEDVPGVAKGNIDGVGGTRRLTLELRNPSFTPFISGLILYSATQDGTSGAYADIDQMDFRVNGISVGRGVIGYVAQVALDGLVAGVEELVDVLILNDLPVEGGRYYGVEGKLAFSDVTTRVVVQLHYTDDGSVPTTASPVLPHGTYDLNTVIHGTTGGAFHFAARYFPANTGLFSVGIFANPDNNINSIVGSDRNGFLEVQDIGGPS